MSWIAKNSLTTFQKFCIKILKCGPIPKHIAIIMDGNRRYARKEHMEKVEGHAKGFNKLAECLSWCLELGIKEVTVYAFSIENFKRTKKEVDQLLQLAREKFTKLFEEKQKLMEYGVCIRVIGNLSLLPVDLRKLMAEAVLMTKGNSKAILNVAFPYTSQDEITSSIQLLIKAAHKAQISVDDIDEELISCCLYTNQSPNPEVLIRTSGEVRLSDFLLWQASESQIFFTDVLWPEFGIWHLLACIFKYQRGVEQLQGKDELGQSCQKSMKIERFLNELNSKRISQMEVYANV
ncbi:dehydrodolichyl diphosphate synthase complex subunit DHDDS-like [Euwallacea similis]|uniref:dehydrodolichyl diphosphate synthase complex subunit DHDDS-like n=1 Tax=Euwallacea similis TaxID=1736056 RepID=UPI00344E34A3